MGFLDRFKKKPEEKELDQKFARREKVKSEEKKDTVKKAPAKKKASTSKKEDTKQAYKVLIKPLITEKGTATGTYLFAVDHKTNKQEIKKAIEIVYGIKPKKVNIINFGGRQVKWGRSKGSTKKWKKAIVYLESGQKIEMFDGV
ncbi:MAG: 50S ribosomal protein L23 [Patescibacteria group bacterium]